MRDRTGWVGETVARTRARTRTRGRTRAPEARDSREGTLLRWARRLAGAGAALFVLAALPEAVQACPVCFDASDENRMAFLATTAFLSLLPLGMVAGAGLYIRRRARELDDAADRHRDTDEA